MRRTRLIPSLLALATVALLAAGCSTTPQSPAPTSTSGSDAAAADHADDMEAVWLDDGRSFAVVTWGSSSCAPGVQDLRADGQTITVDLVDGEEEACTDDLAPRASLASLPEGVDAAKDVQLKVAYGDRTDDVDLDGLADPAAPGLGFGEKPSAAWFDDRGIVLLTYGSSSCRPLVEDVEQTDAGATVTFAEITGVCTMDFAPRTTIVMLPDEHDDDAPFALTLDGGGLEGTVEVTD